MVIVVTRITVKHLPGMYFLQWVFTRYALATDQYVLGAPLFKKVTLTLENGKVVTINAPKNSAENRYVTTLTVDGKPYTNTWLSHKALQKGEVINFNMSATPNKARGTKATDVPYSLSNEK
jgi:putative alpha-1,2-mannosidase